LSFANIAFFSIQLFANILIGITAVVLLFLMNRGRGLGVDDRA